MQTQAVVTYLKGDYVVLILLVCVVEVEDNNYMCTRRVVQVVPTYITLDIPDVHIIF
jgi:hypothetical protein